MKKAIIFLLAAMMALSFAACSSKEEKEKEALRAELEAAREEREKEAVQEEKKAQEAPAKPQEEETPAETPEETAEEPAASGTEESLPEAMMDTKTMAYFVKHVIDGAYTMEMQAEFDGMSTTTLTAVKNGMTYTESEAGGTVSMSIIKDDAMYVLDPANKLCIKMAVEVAEVQEIFADEAEHYETAVSTGETEVKGTMCFYEEFTVEGTSVKYCFVGDDLKYMVTEMSGAEYIMEILRMEPGADDSLFEIPEDYTMMEM